MALAAKLTNVSAEKELKNSYLAYSVAIFNRALPSVVDGLKVSQRRIIQGLKDLNLKPEGSYKKVSRLEGHVLGTLHPQGGCAGTAINMGQATAFRYPLTDIHGNVGGSLQSGPSIGQSTSEDGPAAARYLEVKTTELTQRVFISEIDKHCCEWKPNYDGSTEEVVEIVPALPSLLITGATGIAAGYACHHVPYNLTDVLKATIEYIKTPNVSPKRLFSIVKSPDLPNGARILSDDAVYQAFERGSGTIKLYGTWEVKKVAHGKRSTRDAIIVRSLASGSSERFLDKVKDGVESEKIEGIVDISDHSSREGIEIQVVLKSGADPNSVLSQLLAFTNLADTVSVNATAIDGALPTIMGFKDIVASWHKARCVALSKRYAAETIKLNDKVHILNGFLAILADIDRVVKVIRTSKTKELAAEQLEKQWGLDSVQSAAVLAMPLSRLVNAEQLELKAQKADLEARVAELALIMSNQVEMDNHIVSQLSELKALGDKRRSVLVTQAEIGVEKVKITTKSGTRRVKLPSPKDLIKAEGKKMGMRRPDLVKFFEQSVSAPSIKSAWEEYKENWEHEKSLTTNAGKAKRKKALEAMKEEAIKRGLPKRGKSSWVSFLAAGGEARVKAKLSVLEKELKDWMANISGI